MLCAFFLWICLSSVVVNNTLSPNSEVLRAKKRRKSFGKSYVIQNFTLIWNNAIAYPEMRLSEFFPAFIIL